MTDKPPLKTDDTMIPARIVQPVAKHHLDFVKSRILRTNIGKTLDFTLRTRTES